LARACPLLRLAAARDERAPNETEDVMSEANGAGTGKRLAVLAVLERPDKDDETKKHTRWVKIGVGWANRDGSINLYLDAFPVGSNKLQIREDDRVPLAPGTRRNGLETIEVRP